MSQVYERGDLGITVTGVVFGSKGDLFRSHISTASSLSEGHFHVLIRKKPTA